MIRRELSIQRGLLVRFLDLRFLYIHCLSLKNKSFSLILKTKVDNSVNPSRVKNLFTDDGDYKTIPDHKPKGKYSLEFHLSKTKSEGVESKIIEIIELTRELRGTKIVYSKRRICFKTKFRFMTLEILGKSIHTCIKDKNGWKCFNVKSDYDLGKIKKALHRIHGFSNKPTIKKLAG